MRILAVGYYQHQNVGDEMFADILPKLLKEHSVVVWDLDRVKELESRLKGREFDLIILGGGDLINEYFYPRYQYLTEFGIPIQAWAVGLEFERAQRFLQPLDAVWTRNPTDLVKIAQTVGGDYAHFVPDLGFALPLVETLPPDSLRKGIGEKQVGVVLNSGLNVNALGQFLNSLTGWQVKLIVFDPGDLPVYKTLQDLVPGAKLERPKDWREAFNLINKTSMVLGSKLHSLIFATLLNKPFLSLANTRKCQLYLQENGLNELHLGKNITLAALHNGWKHLSNHGKDLEGKLIRITRQLSNYWKAVLPQLVEISPRMDKVTVDPIVEWLAKFSNLEGTPESQALVITEAITGNPSNKYQWGMAENIKKKVPLKDQINYLYGEVLKETRPVGLNLNYIPQNDFAGLHRSGWQYVVDYLQVLSDKRGIWCDTYLERTFFWQKHLYQKKNIVPYTRPWIGFTHHTALMHYTQYNTVALSNDPDFLHSLNNCQGLFTLSEYMAKWWRTRLTSLGFNITVISLVHPTQCSVPQFKLDTMDYTLVQIGAWYRQMFTIYELSLSKKKKWHKAILKGKAMENYFPPTNIIVYYSDIFGKIKAELHPVKNPAGKGQICRDYTHNKFMQGLVEYINKNYNLQHLIRRPDQVLVDMKAKYYFDPLRQKIQRQIQDLLDSVTLLEYLDNKAYDELLTKSVVLLNLYDASGVNTIVECIVRRTPIIINPLPAVIELLGPNYPLYFYHTTDIPSLLTRKKLREAYHYLLNLSLDPFRIDTFLDAIQTSSIWKTLQH